MSIYANQNDALSSEIQTTTESVELLTSAIIEAEEPINTTPAYVYRLICKPTGQFYYGLRYANIKQYRMPEDDLWIYYFASSDPVDELVAIYGKNSFDYKVIFQSTDIEQTYLFEQTIIKAYWGNPLLLNLQYKDPITGGKMWAATKESTKKAKATGRARGSYKASGERRKADGSAKRAAQKAVVTKRNRGSIERAIQKCRATKIKNGTDKIGARKAAATRKLRGTDRIGSLKAAQTKRETGVDKIAGQKTAATRKANNTYQSGAAKGVATRRASGIDKISAQKAAATRKRTGIDKIAVQKANQTKKDRGTGRIGALKSAKVRRENGSMAASLKKATEACTNTWQLTKPTGEVIVIRNLCGFCRENGLSATCMCDVAKGKQSHHKGWNCVKLD
jgi:hypothetical protein